MSGQQRKLRIPFAAWLAATAIVTVAVSAPFIGGMFTADRDSQAAAKQEVAKQEVAPGIYEVAIDKGKMNPQFIKIKPGESVQFNPKDGETHVIGKGSGTHGKDTGVGHNHEAGSESPPIRPDEGYRVRFSKPGVFNYHDHDAPDARVIVIVSMS